MTMYHSVGDLQQEKLILSQFRTSEPQIKAFTMFVLWGSEGKSVPSSLLASGSCWQFFASLGLRQHNSMT